ncbi:MAG TPA: beta-N-acetylhexosaminidase [Elusimicrobiota bacterium]|nr:beta-N-acetylhexosaminidase [Elusimicrobiota bacterium]
MTMLLEQLIGETLVFGIPGKRIRPEDIRLFRQTHAGGLILYRINFESPSQLRRLIVDLEEALGRRLLVCADHEGGRVVMFREGVTVFPDNLTFGNAFPESDKRKIEAARRQGWIEARELRRLGVDVNLSPVVDVLTERYSPNIGIRSYGNDPGLIARMATARVTAMQRGGLSACAKHFPGKGHSPLDAHLSLPVIPSSWKEMRRIHLKPFESLIRSGIDMVMSSHPLYPNLDPAPMTPATFSKRLIRGLLREEMGFRGVISSDDLEMGAVRDLCPIGEAAVRTARAGHDLLLSCHDSRSQLRVHEALTHAYRSGELSVRDLERSVERIRVLKDRRPHRFGAGTPRAELSGKRLAVSVATSGARLLRPGRGILPVLRGSSRVTVVFPKLSSLARRIMIEKPLEQETVFLNRLYRRHRKEARILLVDIDSTSVQVDRIGKIVDRDSVCVFYCFDAHLYRGCRRLLEMLQEKTAGLSVVLMRDPYDVGYLKKNTACSTAFGFRMCQIEAATGILLARE